MSAAMETLMRCFVAQTRTLVNPPDWLPTPLNWQVRRAIRQLDTVLATVIAERRHSGDDRGDLLLMLVHAEDEDNGGIMSDLQLRDEVMTLFMAGHETTVNTLAWAWYLLSQHPEAEAKLHCELDEVIGARVPELVDLPRLKYTEWVITETLRAYPTVLTVGREAIEAVELGGFRIAPGTTIFMPQWVIHWDARWFDGPEGFDPSRWTDGLMQRIPRYAYFPFGGGPRICNGNDFALMEATLILAVIARKYRLVLAPNAKVSPLPTMTVRPANGVRARLIARR